VSVTDTNGTQLVPFGMQSSAFGPYLAAINRILILVLVAFPWLTWTQTAMRGLLVAKLSHHPPSAALFAMKSWRNMESPMLVWQSCNFAFLRQVVIIIVETQVHKPGHSKRSEFESTTRHRYARGATHSERYAEQRMRCTTSSRVSGVQGRPLRTESLLGASKAETRGGWRC
jgi:hypothetical protein